MPEFCPEAASDYKSVTYNLNSKFANRDLVSWI